jgi:hypothetical protein
MTPALISASSSRGMIAVKVSEEQRGAIVASPRYFESQPKPASPRDLTSHRCISISMGSAGSLEEYVAPHIASGALVRVLEDTWLRRGWRSPFGVSIFLSWRKEHPGSVPS